MPWRAATVLPQICQLCFRHAGHHLAHHLGREEPIPRYPRLDHKGRLPKASRSRSQRDLGLAETKIGWPTSRRQRGPRVSAQSTPSDLAGNAWVLSSRHETQDISTS